MLSAAVGNAGTSGAGWNWSRRARSFRVELHVAGGAPPELLRGRAPLPIRNRRPSRLRPRK
eukprot:168796-Alexandrium_andersonii.AAC.1